MKTDRLFDWIRRIPPFAALIGLLVLAMLVLLGSFGARIADITFVQDGVRRHVGYASAVNWSLGFVIVAPVALYFMLSAFRTADRLPQRLAEASMALNAKGRRMPKAKDVLCDEWELLLKRASRWLMVLIPIAIIANVAEWWACSAGPLWSGKLPDEKDWSVATHLAEASVQVGPVAVATISAGAYLLQTIFVVALLIFLAFLFVFCEFMRQLSDQDAEPVLMLDLRSDDRRRGFQTFEPIVEQILIACAFGFVLFYLSRVWNLYLAWKPPAQSLYDFVITDVLKGIAKAKFDLVGLMDVGGFEYSSVFTTFAALILFILCVGIPIYVLGRSALQARNSILLAIDNGTAAILDHMPPAEAKTRANDLVRWPLGYPKANQLMVLAGVAFLSMFLFRLGFFYLGMIILWLAMKGYKALKTE